MLLTPTQKCQFFYFFGSLHKREETIALQTAESVEAIIHDPPLLLAPFLGIPSQRSPPSRYVHCFLTAPDAEHLLAEVPLRPSPHWSSANRPGWEGLLQRAQTLTSRHPVSSHHVLLGIPILFHYWD